MLGAAADSSSRVSLLSAQAGCLLDTDRKYCAGGTIFVMQQRVFWGQDKCI